MRIGVIQGPNLNRLGRRDPTRYGRTTLAELTAELVHHATTLGLQLDHVQSNHEGVLVDWVHARIDTDDPHVRLDAIVVNPASLTPVGRSLAQAIQDAGLPVAVVHISPVHRDAGPGRIDLFARYAAIEITGCGIRGYRYALDELAIRSRTTNAPEVSR